MNKEINLLVVLGEAYAKLDERFHLSVDRNERATIHRLKVIIKNIKTWYGVLVDHQDAGGVRGVLFNVGAFDGIWGVIEIESPLAKILSKYMVPYFEILHVIACSIPLVPVPGSNKVSWVIATSA